MSFNVIATPDFKKVFKRLYKKYPSLKSDLQKLISIMEEKPSSGTPLGQNLYKIRLSISSKGKGKSGGARVITFLVNDEQEVYLIHIYDKSQLETLTKEQIKELIKKAGLS